MREVVQEINELRKAARDLAHATLMVPKTEREYMIACGRYRELLRQAESLQARFIDERQEDPEDDLSQEESQAPRRVAPQRDRLAQHRARHTPRSV